VGSGEGAVPPPQKIVLFLLCIPSNIYWHYNFQKGHPSQKGRCPDSLDAPGSAPIFSMNSSFCRYTFSGDSCGGSLEKTRQTIVHGAILV